MSRFLPAEVRMQCRENILTFSTDQRSFSLRILDSDKSEPITGFVPGVPAGVLFSAPGKVASLVSSQLKLNRTIYARNCEVRTIDKDSAAGFFNKHHLLNATGGAYHYGLYHGEELVMAATFSKGRKMNRLPSTERSFELIRLSGRSGLTVAGGLSKIIRHFVGEKKPGDIMTYIDRQLSQGEAFIKNGFVLHGTTGPVSFLLDKRTLQRLPYDERLLRRAPEDYHVVKNEGNLKLIYTPDYK